MYRPLTKLYLKFFDEEFIGVVRDLLKENYDRDIDNMGWRQISWVIKQNKDYILGMSILRSYDGMVKELNKEYDNKQMTEYDMKITNDYKEKMSTNKGRYELIVNSTQSNKFYDGYNYNNNLGTRDELQLDLRDIELEKKFDNKYFIFKDDERKIIQLVSSINDYKYFGLEHALYSELNIIYDDHHNEGTKQFGNKEWLISLFNNSKLSEEEKLELIDYTFYNFLAINMFIDSHTTIASINVINKATTENMRKVYPEGANLKLDMRNIEITKEDLKGVDDE